jgi:hypothetical protein
MTMTDSEKLFFAGGAHARAAHAIVDAAQANVHMKVPFYLLVGFSLETMLKAAYVKLGGDIDVAKTKIVHDLPMALNCAKDHGFHGENENLGWLIGTMADAHRNHVFRYLTGDGDIKIPDPTTSLQILDDLVTQVGKLIHPEHGTHFWRERLEQFDPRKAKPGA